MPSKFEQIAGTLADGTRRGVATAMDQVASEIAKKLGEVVTSLERSAAAVASTLGTQDGDRGATSLDFMRDIREATQEMRRVSEELRKVTTVLQQVQSARGEGTSKKADGFFRRWLG
jgi:hypothetical protein